MQESSILALSAVDGLVLTMVALLSFSLGMVLTLLVIIAKSGHRQTERNNCFLDARHDWSPPQENAEVGEQSGDPRAPWERDPDWWRKPGPAA